MLKRIGAFLMALVMVVGMLPAPAYAEETATGDEAIVAETEAPVETTEAPTETTEAPTETTEAPTETTEAPTEETEAPEETTVATEETTAATEETEAAEEETPECTCDVKCTEEEPNENCPLCSTDLTGCAGEEAIELYGEEITFVAYIGDQGYETLNAAIAAAQAGETIALNDGTHTLPSSVTNKNITISGSKNAVVEMLTAVNATGSTVNFKGVTVKFDNDGYEGLQHSTKVTYTDCALIGTQFLYADTVEFTNCTFAMCDAKTEYSVWTYDAKDVTFTDCIFDTNGKAVLVYKEGAIEADIELNNCEFKSNGIFTDKAAVEVGASANGAVSTYTLTFDDKCIADEKFVANKSTSNLWGNKNDMDGEHLTVVIDGVTVYPAEPTYAAKIGETGYETLNAAIGAVEADKAETTVIELADGTHTILLKDGGYADVCNKNITFTGSKNAVMDLTGIVGATWHTQDTGATLTFDGLTVKWNEDNEGYQGFTNADKVVYKNCDIYGTQFMGGDADFVDCVFYAENTAEKGYAVYGRGAGTLTFTGCTFNTDGRAIMLFQDQTTEVNVVLKNCTFKDNGNYNSKVKAAVETGDGSKKTSKFNITIEDCEIQGFEANNSTSPLWGNKDSIPGDRLTVVIDGDTVYPIPDDVVIVAPPAPNASEEEKKAAIEEAVEAAEKKAAESNAPVEVKLPAATNTTTTITDAVAAVQNANSNKVELAIPVKTAEVKAEVKLDNTAVQALTAEAVTKVELTVAPKAPAAETPEEPVAEFEITLEVNDEEVTSFNGGELTITMPAVEAEKVKVYYLNDTGKVYLDSTFTVSGGNVTFTTNHLTVWGTEAVAETPAPEVTNVAEINGQGYATLQDAIDAAAADDVIDLLGDIEIKAEHDKPATHAWVKDGQDVVIDLNGHTVTGAFFINGTATIKNGSIVNKSDVSGIETQGSLTLENVNITSNRHGLRISGGTTNIISGTYTTNATSGTKHAVNISDATVTITAGTFTGYGTSTNGNAAVAVRGNSTLTINGGEFSNDGGSHTIAAWGGVLNITGGSFHKSATDTLNMGGGDKGTSTTGISGGYFEDKPDTGLLQQGKAAMLIGSGDYQGWYEIGDAVAMIGVEPYASLQDAIDAAAAGKTVTLMVDVTEAMVTVKAGKDVDVDFAGKTLNGSMLVEKGAAADIRNGKIYQIASVAGIEVQGVATLTDMDITSKGRHAIRVDGLNTEGTKLTIYSGTYTTASDPEAGSYYALNAGEKSVVEVKGGKFVGNGGGQGAFIVKSEDTLVTIEDGEFLNGDAIIMQVCNTTVITGGKYGGNGGVRPSKGYVLVEINEAPYKYEVVKLTNWLQVADTSWYDASKNTFTIKTAEQLAGLAELVNGGTTFAGKTVALAGDIDLSGKTYGTTGVAWPGIGVYSKTDMTKAFQGTFNGANSTVSGVTFADNKGAAYAAGDPNNYRGFFNQIANATVESLTVSGSIWTTAPSTSEYGGALIVGHAYESTISQCRAVGSVRGTHNVAGIVVRIKDTNVIGCTNEASLTGSYSKMGGIVALSQDSQTGCLIEGCTNIGLIASTARGEDGVGGIIGWIGYPGLGLPGTGSADEIPVTIKDCMNSGEIRGTSTALIGQMVGKPHHYMVVESGNVGLDNQLAVGTESPVGFAFATHDGGNTVTYVTELEAGKTYWVTAKAAKPVIELAPGQSISFDTTLAALGDVIGITAVTKIEVATEGSVTTYKAGPLTNWLQVADITWYKDSANSFTIETAEQLAGLAELVNEGKTFEGKTVTLGANIDLSGATYGTTGVAWPGIGLYRTSNQPFKGTFDGASKTISGMTFADNGTAEDANTYRGLFNHLEGATVKNVTVSGSGFVSGITGEYGGAMIAGYANGSTISGCVAEGSISGTHNVAGIVVRVQDSTISGCTNKAALTGSHTKLGGIAALVQESVTAVLFENCVNEGAITSTAKGDDGVGGIVGWIGYPNTANITVRNCENKGVITATATAVVGQIAGESWNGNHIFEGNKGLATTVATGHSAMSGLNFATVDGNVATYVTALEAGKTYLVTAPTPAPVIELAPGESITFDTTLTALGDASGITAKSAKLGMEKEPVTEGKLITYKAVNLTNWSEVADTTWYNETDTTFEIDTAEKLAGLAQLVNAGTDSFKGKTITLTADIDLSGKDYGVEGVEWTPIGTSAKPFAGNFDGGEKTISNLSITNTNRNNLGLFGYAGGDAEKRNAIEKVTLSNVNINSKSTEYVGALIGNAFCVNLTDCHVVGEIFVKGGRYTGGLVGGGYITANNCSVAASVKDEVNANIVATYQLGGIIGIGNSSKIYNCTVDNVCIKSNSGGWVGGIGGHMGEGGFVSGNTLKNTSIVSVSEQEVTGLITGNIVASASYTYYVINNTVENSTAMNGSTSVTTHVSKDTIDTGMNTFSGTGVVMDADNKLVVTAESYEICADSLIDPLSMKVEEEKKVIRATAQIGTTNYATLADAIKAANAAAEAVTVKILEDCTLDAITAVTGNMTLDLNGKTITLTVNGRFDLGGSANVTVTGNGRIENQETGADKTKHGYLFVARDNSTLTIENGTFYAGLTAAQANDSANIYIEGGSFKAWSQYENKYWILNQRDGAAGKIVVTGGEFYEYNPADNDAEGEYTGFAPGMVGVYNEETGYYTLREGKYVARVDGKQYESLQEAVNAAKAGSTVTLIENIDLTATVVVDKKITLDLNGKTITNPNPIWVEANKDWSLISVRGGDLTIIGQGNVHGLANDCYALDVQTEGKLTIENGSYLGNWSTVYVKLGEVVINGGHFDMTQLNDQGNKNHMVNASDVEYGAGTAKITINGGEFVGFNPSCNAAEGQHTNFAAEGKIGKETNGVYTLVDGDNFEAEETAPTYTADGFTTYTCKVCGYSYKVVHEGTKLEASITGPNGTVTGTIEAVVKEAAEEGGKIELGDKSTTGEAYDQLVTEAIKAIAAAETDKNIELVVTDGDSSVTFNKAAAESIAGKTEGNAPIVLSIENVTGTANVTGAEVTYEITLKQGNEDVFAADTKGTAVVSIPAPETVTADTKFTVNYVDDAGNKTPMADAKFENGKIIFTTTHFSTYTVELKAEVELFELAGANMLLGNSLAMNFFINKSDVDVNGVESDMYYAVITKKFADGKSDSVKKYMSSDWDVRDTMFAVTYQGVMAKEMADELTVVIYRTADDVAVSEVWNDSVRDYAMRMVDKGTDVRKTFFVDMLNYGAAAQNYFNYNEGDPANNKLNDAQKAYATGSVTMTNNRVNSETYYGSSLSLESSIVLNIYFKDISADAVSGMKANITFTDHYGNAKSVDVNGNEFYVLNADAGRYGVLIDEIAVADARQMVTVTMYNADGSEYGSVTDSMESYIARMSSKDALYEYTMKFCVSAYSYLHSLA